MRGVWSNQQLFKEQDRIERLYRWANSGEDFWPIKDWPSLEKSIFLKRPKERTYNERFTLLKFLFMNGMEARQCLEWVGYVDIKGIPWYDDTRANEEHYKSLIQMGVNGELNKYPYWDMHEGRLWGKKQHAQRQYLRKSGRDFF